MSRGHDRERRVRALLREEGWIVVRAAGSLGDIDLVAMRAEPIEPSRPLAEVMMIEVKSESGNVYKHFGPRDRAILRDAARRGGASAWLYSWPPRGELMRIPASDWPGG